MSGSAGTSTQGRVAPTDRIALLQWYKQEVVNHARLHQVRNQTLQLFEDDDPASILMIVGPPGAGKTTLLESLQKKFGERSVLLEARSPEGRAYDNREHCRLLLEQLGDPAPDEHFSPEQAAIRRQQGIRRPAIGRRATLSDLRLALERMLPLAGIECVLIDEAQHMFNGISGRRLAQQMDMVKSMSNLSGVRHVLAGQTELLSLVELTPQLHRRARVILFSAYRQDRKKDREQFLAAFRALVERVPLEGQKELSGEFEYVLENTAGCVGMLKDWLRRALAYALRNGLPSIDGKALRETVLDPGAVHEIADDASKCGLPHLHETQEAKFSHAKVKTRRSTKTARVERAPAIDPVGQQQEAT